MASEVEEGAEEELSQPGKARVTRQCGDVRSAVCEQSRPAGEQSQSLARRYYKRLGSSVWTCTCWRAGLAGEATTPAEEGVGYFLAVGQ